MSVLTSLLFTQTVEKTDSFFLFDWSVVIFMTSVTYFIFYKLSSEQTGRENMKLLKTNT